MSQVINVRFPAKLRGLDRPYRYKFVRGGRGSGKSWGIARKLLLAGTQKPERILCTREVQKSISQSVHQLLKDQIAELGLQNFYEVLLNEIRGLNGTRFYFSGLSDQTATSIKSFEGCTICWIEEGQTISKTSWEILTPTIRAENSEIWVTYNPQLESDYIHQKAEEDREEKLLLEMNYNDNPWFPDVLEAERQHDEKVLPSHEYNHKWGGKCMPAVEGAIYFNEIAAAQEHGRIARIPYDPLLKVHSVWDLGFNDSMFIGFVQRLASEIRIIDAIEDNQRTLPSYINEDFKARQYNWGDDWLPHDGFATRHQTGKSDAVVLKALGRSIQQTPNMDVESGIRRAREVFPRIYFNSESPGVMRLVECLKRYRRHISKATNEPGAPVHDEFSHGADMFRYLCINADKYRNENNSAPPSATRNPRPNNWNKR